MKLPKTIDGACSKCGEHDMLLARDKTMYAPCEYESGEWVPQSESSEESEDEDAVRFYCVACGERHQIPKELS